MSDEAAPLRIMHVVEVFGSGVGIVAKTLAERQAENGEQVVIAHGRCPETPAEVRGFVAAAVELRELPWEERSPREQMRAGRALRRLVDEWRPDVVHLHSSFAGVVGGMALPRRVPCVYTPHGYSFTMRDRGVAKRLAFRTAERFTAARVDVVGAVSEAEAVDARQVAPAGKVAVVPNGIPELDDPPPPRPLEAAGGRALVVTVGRVADQHMPVETATILAGVSDLAEVVWVGGDGRSPELDEAVRQRGVRVTGWLEREEVQSILASASLCLHWTAWDGQPLSVLEAMAADVPVIARDIAATREILGPDQVCGSPEEATGLLRVLIVEPTARERLLEAQRERRIHYGSRRMAADWRAVYARLASPDAVRRGSEGTPAGARGSRWGRRARRYESSPGAAP